MNKASQQRYDAWGNPILPHLLMRVYYENDLKSMKVLRQKMPHQYIVLPQIEIRFYPSQPHDITVYYVYPGGSDSKAFYISDRALCALRRAYRGKGGWVGGMDKNGYVVLKRRGRVLADPTRKYWPGS